MLKPYQLFTEKDLNILINEIFKDSKKCLFNHKDISIWILKDSIDKEITTIDKKNPQYNIYGFNINKWNDALIRIHTQLIKNKKYNNII